MMSQWQEGTNFVLLGHWIIWSVSEMLQPVGMTFKEICKKFVKYEFFDCKE